MRIGVANYRVGENHSVDNYLMFIGKSVQGRDLDVFVGPDYALSGVKVLDLQVASNVKGKVKKISVDFPETVIIAGTMARQSELDRMVLKGLVFKNGKCQSFLKKTDQGESSLARNNGLIYQRGVSNPSIMDISGKKAWFHICGDWGRKPEDYCDDADLEIALTYDTNSGIHRSVNSPNNSRHIVLCDGQIPVSDVAFYDGRECNFLKPNIRDVGLNENKLFIYDLLGGKE